MNVEIGTFVAFDTNGDVAQAFPATGKSFAITRTHWIRIADGKVIEHWANRDDLGMSMQVGALPRVLESVATGGHPELGW
ncbi:ester cyclase [Nocardia sp. NPDC055053]